MDVSSTSKPHVSFEFEVEKILGVSSDGSYQVQWAPSWVSKLYLVGCEHLIDEFLHQQREVKTEPANLTDVEHGNEIPMNAEPSQSNQYGIEMKSEPGQLLDNLSNEEDENIQFGRNDTIKDEPHQSSLQELSFQEPGEEIHVEADTCVAAKLSSELNYGSDKVVRFNDNNTLDNTVTKYCNQFVSLDIQQKQQQQHEEEEEQEQQHQQRQQQQQQQEQQQQQVMLQHNSLSLEEEDDETPHIPREDKCFETEITSSKRLGKSSPPGIDASVIDTTVENLSKCHSSNANAGEKYSLRSRRKVGHCQNEHQSSDKQHGKMKEIIYDSKFSGNNVECRGPSGDDHSCDVGQNFNNSTNPESELKCWRKRRKQCVALQHIWEGGEEEPNAHSHTGETSDVHSTSRFDEYSSSSNSPGDVEERPVPSGDGLGEDESTTSNSQPQYSLRKKSSSARKKRCVRRHIRTHTSETPYACDQCSFSCVTKGGLMRHQRTHTGEKPYSCMQCSYSCSRKDNLTRHMATHTAKKPYSCKHCSFSCSDKTALYRHLQRHTGERLYKCDQCPYSSVRKSTLACHIRIHTGEKPHVCDQCTYSCVDKGSLKRHLRTHTGEKPFLCNQCTYSSVSQSHLKRHLRTHTGEKPYSCGVCGRKFGRAEHRNRHISQSHHRSKTC